MTRMSKRAGDSKNRARVLAIASGGGHWVQLLRLGPAFEGCEITFATVRRSYEADVEGARFHLIPDATRWNKFAMIWLAIRIILVLIRVRPSVVVTTGAAPGLIAIVLARLVRARTVWIDSVANVEEMSLSGQKAASHADLWLTQWPHLTSVDGPVYAGQVL